MKNDIKLMLGMAGMLLITGFVAWRLHSPTDMGVDIIVDEQTTLYESGDPVEGKKKLMLAPGTRGKVLEEHFTKDYRVLKVQIDNVVGFVIVGDHFHEENRYKD